MAIGGMRETGPFAGYARYQRRLFRKFIHDFVDVQTLEPWLDPGHEETSLWTDGTLVGLRGQEYAPPNDDRHGPRVRPEILQATGHQHFRDFRGRTVGGISMPHPDKLVEVSYVPPGAFFALDGLPQNVRDLETETATVVAAARFPYIQTAALPDLPPPLLERLHRESFGEVPHQAGTQWDVNVVFAVHFAALRSGRHEVVGRTGLNWDGPDVVSALHSQVLAQRGQGTPIQALAPEEVARQLSVAG